MNSEQRIEEIRKRTKLELLLDWNPKYCEDCNFLISEIEKRNLFLVKLRKSLQEDADNGALWAGEQVDKINKILEGKEG